MLQLLSCQIFYGDSYLSKKLTKSDLGKIFYTAIMSGTAGHYQWTIVLQTIVEVLITENIILR